MALAICQANHILLLIFYSPLLLQFLGGTHKTVKSLLIGQAATNKPVQHISSGNKLAPLEHQESDPLQFQLPSPDIPNPTIPYHIGHIQGSLDVDAST